MGATPTIQLPPPPIIDSLVTTLLQKADLCNTRIHQTSFWFAGVAIIGYFLSKSDSASLVILGATVLIPRAALIATLPLVLAALFYSMSSFISLEDQYYEEMRRLLNARLTGSLALTPFQLKLLESPAYYTINELRAIKGSHRLSSAFGSFAGILIVLIYGVAPFLVVAWYVFAAYGRFGMSWTFGLEALAAFLAIFGFIQLFETL